MKLYEALGLPLVAEQHGGGPPHYSSTVGGVVLELYPASGKTTSGLRLGLTVSNVAAAVAKAEAAGAQIVRPPTIDTPDAALIRDLDGHVIELAALRPAPREGLLDG